MMYVKFSGGSCSKSLPIVLGPFNSLRIVYNTLITNDLMELAYYSSDAEHWVLGSKRDLTPDTRGYLFLDFLSQ